MDLNVMVPFIATVIVLAVGILVICVAYNRRRGPDSGRGNSKDVYCMSFKSTSKIHNIRTQYFMSKLILSFNSTPCT